MECIIKAMPIRFEYCDRDGCIGSNFNDMIKQIRLDSWALINPIALVRSDLINSIGLLESRRICVVASHCIRIRFGLFVIAPFVWL